MHLFHHLCVPLLDNLHYIHVSLAWRSPEFNPALQMWPHQCWGEENHLLQLSGSALLQHEIAFAAFDARAHFCLHQDPHILFCKVAEFSSGCSGAWDHSSSNAGSCTSPYWTSWNFFILNSFNQFLFLQHLLYQYMVWCLVTSSIRGK